jgi:uncharacterized protein (UPF0212 family)
MIQINLDAHGAPMCPKCGEELHAQVTEQRSWVGLLWTGNMFAEADEGEQIQSTIDLIYCECGFAAQIDDLGVTA